MSKTIEALPDSIYENYELFVSIIEQSKDSNCRFDCLECSFGYEHDNSWLGQVIAGVVVIEHYFVSHLEKN